MLMIGTFYLPSALLSSCSWSSFYFWLRWMEPERKPEWHCRIVTVIHAMLITAMSGWAVFVQGPSPFTNAGGPNTELQVIVTVICLGYFLFDFSWCIYFQSEGPPMLLHHTLSIIGLTWTLVGGKYGTEMMATICGSEVTNPILQLRWFIKEIGYYQTLLGEVVDLAFMISFFTMRIVIGSMLLYCYFQQPTDFWGRFAAISIYLVGWMFWISIFQFAIHKYTKKYRAWCESVQDASAGTDGAQQAAACRNGQQKVSSAQRLAPRSYKLLSNGVHHRSNGKQLSCNGDAQRVSGTLTVKKSPEESSLKQKL